MRWNRILERCEHAGRRSFWAILPALPLVLVLLPQSEAGADIRSDELTPHPELRQQAAEVDPDHSRIWSQANARQAFSYAAGYAFGYEFLRNFACDVFPFDNPFLGFFNFRNLLNSITSEATAVVSANNDTLYSASGLNLDAEPVVFSAPAVLNENDRYWSNMIQDVPSNVPHVLGSESTGTGDFVITWEGWEGPLPTNLPVFEIQSPFAFMIIRTGVFGPDDLDTVHAIQDQYVNTPLSEYCATNKCKFKGNPNFTPQPSRAEELCARYPANFSATPQGAIDEPLAWWEAVNIITDLNPPPSYETGLLQMYKDILVGPDGPTDLQENRDDYPAPVINQLEAAPSVMVPVLEVFSISLGELQNGWSRQVGLGEYGNTQTGDPYRYLSRGAINIVGPAGLPTREAVYYLAFTDAVGDVLDGSNTYELVLDPVPPVSGFWSVTLYNNDGFLYDNGEDGNINNDIYKIGSQTAQPDAGGGVTITMSHSPTGSPPPGVANWLPAPAASFYLAVRTYGLLDVSYFPPPVVKE